MSIVMYNTLIDACARCGRMDEAVPQLKLVVYSSHTKHSDAIRAQVPQIREDMRKYGVRPNVITYSTILKGLCQSGVP
eukprot:2771720-Amphidinium_carterae.1